MAFDRIGSRASFLEIGGVPAADLAQRFGTPLYVIDASVLLEQLREAQSAFAKPRFSLLYSIKANPNLHLISFLRRRGLRLDACSPGDVFLARTAGASEREISYTGVGLDARAMRLLIRDQVWVNLDSLQEVALWAEIAPGRAVGLRVVPDIAAGFHPHCQSGTWGGKFGIAMDDVPRAHQLLSAASCSVRVIHTHLGSSIGNEAPYIDALDRLLECLYALPAVDTINLGGGLRAPFHPSEAPFPVRRLASGIEERLTQFEAVSGRRLSIELEPGEYLVSEAGYLLSRVQVVKRWHRNERAREVVILDNSMNLMQAHSLYGSYFQIYVDGKSPSSDDAATYDVYGTTNQTGDRLAFGRSLPRLVAGDLVAFRNAGAYAYSRSTQFNERPRPAEIWIEDKTATIVREPEHFEDLLRGQPISSASLPSRSPHTGGADGQ